MLPLRPGYGTRGEKVLLLANYYELLPSPELVLYRYNVAIQPSVKGGKLTQIIKLLLELPEFVNFRDDIVTDFSSTLICCKNLGSERVETAIQYKAEGEDEPTAYALSYRIRVEFTGTLTVSQLTDYLTSSNVSSFFSEKQPLLQALNIFLGNYTKASPTIATINSKNAGGIKNFSTSPATPKLDLGAGLLAIRGFFSSVRVATCRILVNVNVSNGVFYDAIPLDQLIMRFGQSYGYDRDKLASFLKKLRVKTIHLPEKRNKAGQIVPRLKTIFGLAKKGDGRSSEHPPRVGGLGSRDVSFFYDGSSTGSSNTPASQGAGKAGGKQQGKGKNTNTASTGPGQGVGQGEYISVYDFFKTGTWVISIQFILI